MSTQRRDDLSLEDELQDARDEIERLRVRDGLRSKSAADTTEQLERVGQEISELRASNSWRMTAPFRALANVLRAILRGPMELTKSVRVVGRSAWRRLPVSAQSRTRLHLLLRRNVPVLYGRLVVPVQYIETRESAPKLPPVGDVSAAVTDDVTGAPSVPIWQDYPALSARLRRERAERINALETKPLKIVEIPESGIAKQLRVLVFHPVLDPQVSIVIPVFNKLRLTVECLVALSRSLQGSRYVEVIIADDASTDATERLLAGVPNVVYVRSEVNAGFVRNCNRAAAVARGRYIVFLNNDVQVGEDCLAKLQSELDGDESMGVAGPKFVYPNGRLQEAGAVVHADGRSTMVGLFEDPDEPAYSFNRDVDYCSGACLMIARDLFNAVGGFTDEFEPAYCEDVDLCLKVRDRGLRVRYVADAVAVHHLSATTGDRPAASKTRMIARNRQKLIDRWQDQLSDQSAVRLIAFYLPQFHPIPENDLWWGKGFTEWTNVTKARPNFVGHHQPFVPADLGYYDLRVGEVLDAQIALARRYGLGGFCFYYYWFAGKRLLEKPLESMLARKDDGYPFCICWANENWTRRWDGMDSEILVSQAHSSDDDRAVIGDMSRYLQASHYIRVHGKPLILVYRVDQFPNFRRTADTWRRYCREAGLGEIYVAMVESFTQAGRAVDPAEYGCDACVEFPPHNFGDARRPTSPLLNSDFDGALHDYQDMVARYVARPGVPFKRFRGVMPSWDNTPRRQDHSQIFVNSSPGAFQAWVENVVDETRQRLHGDERLVFVNAWNEWAEGAYLEPDKRYGHSWLEAIRDALDATWLVRP